MSLKKDTLWAAIDTFVNQFLGFGFRLLLAHQLAPAAFGILAMATATLSILQMINDFGISSTLIQRKREQFDEAFIATAFTGAFCISVILFLVNALVVAPLSGGFFKNDMVGPIVFVSGLSFIMTPFSTVSQALLLKDRQFDRLAQMKFISLLAGLGCGVSVLLIFKTIWAFVVQLLVTQFLSTVLFYWQRRWPLRFRWDAAIRAEIFGFSGTVFLNNLLVACFKNIDQIILGRMFPPALLGLYSLSNYMTDTVRTSLMSIMNRVMFVHYAEHQDNPRRMEKDYLKTLRWNCSIIFPPMLVLMFAGDSLLPLAIGPKWAGVGAVMPYLAGAVMVHAMGGSTSTLLTAIGKPGLDLRLFAATTLFFAIPAMLVGAHFYGVTGVAVAVLLAKAVSVFFRQFVMHGVIGMSGIRYLKVIGLQIAEVIPLALALLVLDRTLTSNPIWYVSLVVLAALPYGGLFLWRFMKG